MCDQLVCWALEAFMELALSLVITCEVLRWLGSLCVGA